MKYPQLVSTRAVNAISDWLVSQLEQLGVEAPLIYSRLLLSLLHTSIQINDLTEFNDIETHLSNRKGNKRNPPCDTDTLKKLTAVQCLMETVSSEQEITKIENLIEELCEKLNDIENNQEENNSFTEEDKQQQSESSSTKLKSNEIEDPRKRYYRAFPALSKEMEEDSIWLRKKNFKALTWPTGNINNTVISAVVNTTPNVVNSLNNTAGVKRKTKRQRNQAMSKGKMRYIRKNSYGGGGSNINNNNNNNNSSPIWDIDFEGSWEMGHDLIKEFITKQNNRNRRCTSESEACNIRCRRRSEEEEKETASAINVNESSFEGENCGDYDNFYDLQNNENTKSLDDVKITNLNLEINQTINDDLSISNDETSISHNAFIQNDEGYSTATNDALTSSLSGINSMVSSTFDTTEGALNSARRLYERDVSNDSLDMYCPTKTAATEQQNNDFAQFKAKFNSSVEALWKNNNGNDNNIDDGKNLSIDGNNTLPSSLSSSSLFKHKNLENFWTNYYNHHYDIEKNNITQYNSIDTNNSTVIGTDETDFFSMPVNFDSKINNDKNNSKASIVETNFAGNVFLQNSIWSDNSLSLPPPSKGTGTRNKNFDESDGGFYVNVLESSYKNETKMDNKLCEMDNTSASVPYTFNISKWSECSFETPFVPSSSSTNSSSIDTVPLNKKDLRENMLKNSYLYNYKQPINNGNSKSIISSSIQQNPIQQQQQQQQFYQKSSSSSSSNSLPITKTDFFDIINTTLTTSASTNNILSSQNNITLKNHSKNSGFIEYSLIKSIYKNKNISNKIIKNHDKLIISSNNNSSCQLSSFAQHSFSMNCKTTTAETNLSPSPLLSGASGENVSTDDDNENLLTSDRTHFRPIKQNYADGYEFDISNNIDEIKFERSKSGYLLFESEKYLQYTRYDTFLSDDEPIIHQFTTTATTTSSSSSSSIIAGNDEEIDNIKMNINKNKRKIYKNNNEFALKFRIKQIEKYCQTDNLFDENEIIDKNINESIILCENKNLNIMKICNKNDDDNYLNDNNEKCVNLEQWSKAGIDKQIEKYCQTNNFFNEMGKIDENIERINKDYIKLNIKTCLKSINLRYAKKLENHNNDDFEFNKNLNKNNDNNYLKDNNEQSVNLEQWSMAEIGKKCHQQNNNSAAHTLWGMCHACNTMNTIQMKSLPANRLLKDELNVEGDEIMSDLKYMQDLYIGNNNNFRKNYRHRNDEDESFSDWDEDDDDDIDDLINDNDESDNDTDYDAEMLKECELYETMVLGTLTEDDQKQLNKDNNDDDDDLYYDVTKFISDLLKPENAKSLANALGAATITQKDYNKNDKEQQQKMLIDDDEEDERNISMTENNNSIIIRNNNIEVDKYIGGIWSNNDENIIWKTNEESNSQQESKIAVSSNDDYLEEEKQQQQQQQKDKNSTSTFLEKFGNWKYSNLAKLWKTTHSETTCNYSLQEMVENNKQLQQHFNNNNKINNENINKENIDEQQQRDKQTTSSEPEKQNLMDKNIIKSGSLTSCSDHHSSNTLKDFISLNIFHNKQQQQKNLTNTISIEKNNNNIKMLNKQQSLPPTIEMNKEIIIDSIAVDKNSKNIIDDVQQHKIMNRIDRKRRHSASQTVNLSEIIDKHHNNENLNEQRSASDFIKSKIGILMKKRDLKPIKTVKDLAVNYDNYDNTDDDNNDVYKKMMTKTNMKNFNVNNESSSSPTTIITCKYWATTTTPAEIGATPMSHILNDTFASKTFFSSVSNTIDDNNDCNNIVDCSHFGDGISTTLSLNPSSILKQVAVAARPLTR